MSKQSVNQKYSKKNKSILNASQLYEIHNKDCIGLKVKLPPLSPQHFTSKRTQSIIEYPRNLYNLPKDPLDKIIKDTQQEYESAIKKHLNINLLPDDHEEDEEHSPLVKIKTNSPHRFHTRYSSKSVTDHYSGLNHSTETKKIYEEYKQSAKKVQFNSISPNIKPKTFKIPDNLEGVRLLLTKLKK